MTIWEKYMFPKLCSILFWLGKNIFPNAKKKNSEGKYQQLVFDIWFFRCQTISDSIFFLSVLVIHCYMGFSLVAASCSYSSCGAQTLIAMASLVVEHRLWSTRSTVVLHGPMAPWHVRSSQMKDRTHISCSGRQILYHWATREAWQYNLYSKNFPHNKNSI